MKKKHGIEFVEDVGDLRQLSRKEGLSHFDLFVRWFRHRFGFKQITAGYVKEWISRFKTGNPVVYMDEESQRIYFDELTKYSTVLRNMKEEIKC